MSEEQYRKALRHERKMEKFPRRRTCVFCEETDIRTLQISGGKLLCADCRLESSGKSSIERHHPAGRRNDSFTVDLSGNEHAILNDMQAGWPPMILRNPKKSRLLGRAATLRASRDVLLRAIELLEGKAEEDENLYQFLIDRLGENGPLEFEETTRRKSK